MSEGPDPPIAGARLPGEQSPRYLFVYGTLLSSLAGRGIPSLQRWTGLVGTGRVAGSLYDTGDYPAAVLSGEGNILGELHAIRGDGVESLLSLLDSYEQYSPHRPDQSLFVRRVTEVEMGGGERMPAWIYEYNRGVNGMRRIVSGDYARYRGVSAEGSACVSDDGR